MTSSWHGGRPPVALVGPTASGKSAMAMVAARAVAGTEIVVVDSMQVYRGTDIGTAKPSPDEQAEVRHHGIDLVDPGVDFSVTEVQEAADTALATIAGRGGRALMVAGTGLYLRVVVDALDPPGQWPDVRAELDVTSDTVALHERLAELDPVGASRMEPTNRRRVVRALEVTVGSGRPFSSFGPGLTAYPTTDVVQLGLRWPRPMLAERIEQRFVAMLSAGLVEEVERLAAGPGGLSRTAAQALGYAELFAHLAGRVTLEEALETAVRRTRRFARRQRSWFARDPRISWLRGSDPVDLEAPLAAALGVDGDA